MEALVLKLTSFFGTETGIRVTLLPLSEVDVNKVSRNVIFISRLVLINLLPHQLQTLSSHHHPGLKETSLHDFDHGGEV